MGDLFIGLAALITALSSGFALIWTTVRSGRKPEKVAKSAAEESAAAIVDALADGKLTPAEIRKIREVLGKGGDPS